jgi:hypothetical protein
VAAIFTAGGAAGQVLYKWIDAEGKVHYSDRPPKDFKGAVQRIEPDPDAGKPASPAAGSRLPPVKDRDASAPSEKAPAGNIAAKRRATRAQLEERLERARAGVESAKKALAVSESPGDDERQVIQQRQAAGGMHGMTGRSNCRIEVGKDGRKVQMCPTAVPTPEYHDRIARLEADLKKAEEELAAAEMAWRRGVD